MAKVAPITEQFQHLVRDLRDSFWGDVYGKTRLARRRGPGGAAADPGSHKMVNILEKVHRSGHEAVKAEDQAIYRAEGYRKRRPLSASSSSTASTSK
jgi:hypothetical protein